MKTKINDILDAIHALAKDSLIFEDLEVCMLQIYYRLPIVDRYDFEDFPRWVEELEEYGEETLEAAGITQEFIEELHELIDIAPNFIEDCWSNIGYLEGDAHSKGLFIPKYAW